MPRTQSNSTTEKNSPQIPQNVRYAQPYDQPFEDDTIDLYELWITLWDKKWIVIGVTAVAALGSAIYALQQPAIYKSEAIILPPERADIRSLNIKGSGYSMTPEGVFEEFIKNLKSRVLQKKFITNYGLMEILAPERTPEMMDVEIYESFANMFIFADGEPASISIELQNPDVAAQWVNDYVKFMETETILRLLADVRNTITKQIVDIDYIMRSKRQMAKQRREDRIFKLEEASIIADKLGIKDWVDATSIIDNKHLTITTTNTPVYLRGTKALKAEISILKNRLSDDPFISGLRDLQEKLALLRSIKIEVKGLHAVNIDQEAYPPTNRIRPKRRVIASIGTVVGLFLGIFLAFFVSYVQKRKELHLE